MTRTCRLVVFVLLSCVPALAPAASAQSQAPPGAPVPLSIPGRASSAPWIAAQGDLVAVAWAAAAAQGGPDIFTAVSRDGGATFAAPVRVNTVAGDGRVSGEIPPRVAVWRRPDGAAEIVVAWNAKDRGTEIKIARSRDGGATFAAPVSLQSPGAAGDRGWHSLTLDAQGTAHVLWLDHRDLAAAKSAMPAMDHAAHAAHAADTVADGSVAAQKSSLYYASYGAAASGERAITPGVCYCCKSAIVALPGGRLVSAWRHVYPGDQRDIAFTTSVDGGRTFAAPARVSADGWSINGCPDDGPALAAGADARVHVVWPTVIPGDEPVGAVFYSTLGDGGAFAPRTRVPTLGAPKPSHPQVVVDASGRVTVAWDESQGGMRTAAYVVGERDAGGVMRFGTPQRLAAPGTPSTYPVMAVTSRGVVTAWTSGAPGQSVVMVRTLGGPSAAPTAAMAAHGGAQHQMPQTGAPDHMDHRFDDPERYAKSFDDPERDAWQLPSRVIDALALTPGARVADIGAGTGYFSMRLAAAAAAPKVFAVDLEPAMVAHLTKRAAAEKRANVVAVQATASSPNLPEPVDVVLVVDTYHHIPGRTAYFAALREKLRPGGRVAIVDFKKGVPGGPPDDFRFTPAQITQEMTAAGYTLAAEHQFLPRQLFLVFTAR